MVIEQFVRDVSKPDTEKRMPTEAQVFENAASPFLRRVWPQERSLTTPSVSRALAPLPAAAGDAFENAVSAVERFLIPFDCRSIRDYGFRSHKGNTLYFSMISDESKASAFVRLLDLTVGISEGAVIPYELSDALDRIRRVAPNLVNSQSFRRLSTATRR